MDVLHMFRIVSPFLPGMESADRNFIQQVDLHIKYCWACGGVLFKQSSR